MDKYDEINDIAMNPRSDEYMDVERYDSYAKASHPEYGGFESPKKKETEKVTTVKTGVRVSNFIIKADLVATIALVTAVVGPTIISDQFEEIFSAISCDFVETISDTNEIDYYLSIDSLEKTLGNVELRVTSAGYTEIYSVGEGKNIGEIKNLKENTNYTLALYDGAYLVKKTEVKTLTQEEKEERAWRRFFENFLYIDYDKEEDFLKMKMKIIDDLNSYEWLFIRITDENEYETFCEFSSVEMNKMQNIPLRSSGVYGKELYIEVVGYLKYDYNQEEYEDIPEDILYEGTFMLDEAAEPLEPIEKTSEVTVNLISIIPDMGEVSYCYEIGNVDKAESSIYLEVVCNEDVRSYDLYEGKNTGLITDLEIDAVVTLSVYEGDILISTNETKTLTEEEIANRGLVKFYSEYLEIYYDSYDHVFDIKMKVIDDIGYYGGFMILVYGEEDIVIGEASCEPSEANEPLQVYLEYDESLSIARIQIYGYVNNATESQEELLCVIEYNLMEGTYETTEGI
ncbi:MAG: hypothetical protein J5666_07630 [Bacilli bacterium]|nr:hypothetical protein [Bacilli bacterium]